MICVVSALFTSHLLLSKKTKDMILVMKEPSFFILMACLNGTEKSQAHFLLGISFIQSVHSKKLIRFSNGMKSLIFTSVLVFLEIFRISSTHTIQVTQNINLLTGAYIYLNLYTKLHYFKYLAIKEGDELTKEANELEKKEVEEYSFMKRFSHFSKTSLHGITNSIYFLKMIYLVQENIPLDKLKKVTNLFVTLDLSFMEFSRQTTDILSYYMITSQKFKPVVHKAYHRIREAILHAVKVQEDIRVKKSIEGFKKVNIKITFDDESGGLPQLGYFDLQRLTQILSNLFSNAIKYSQSHEKEGNVSIRVYALDEPEPIDPEDGECAGDDHTKPPYMYSDISTQLQDDVQNLKDGDPTILKYIHIKIRDNGIGIDKDKLSQIFLPLGGSHDKNFESFSLGLTCCLSFSHTHLGGNVFIQSRGKAMGTTSTLHFPCVMKNYKNDAQEEVEVEGEEEEDDDDDDYEYYVSGDCHPVLLVEDISTSLQIFVKQVEKLTKEQSVIKTATNGFEALHVIRNSFLIPYSRICDEWEVPPPQSLPVVLTDIDMPFCSGLDLCRRLRGLFGDRIVIYAMTATLVNDAKGYGQKHGFDGVMTKPILPMKMKEILQFAFRERRKRIEGYRYDTTSSIVNSSSGGSGSVGLLTRNILHTINMEDETTAEDNHQSRGEEDEEFEVVDIIIEKDAKVELTGQTIEGDLSMTIFTIVINTILSLFCWIYGDTNGDMNRGSLIYLSSWVVSSVFQFTIVKYLGLSPYVNNVLSVFKTLLTSHVGSMKAYFPYGEYVYIVQISYVAQTHQAITGFKASSILSFLLGAQSLCFMLFRPYEMYVHEFDDKNFFVKIFDEVCLFYFIMFILTTTLAFENDRREREEILREYIKKKNHINHFHNLSISKIGHDMSTPATALSYYVQSLGETIFSQFKKKFIIVGDDLEEGHFKMDFKKKNKLKSCDYTMDKEELDFWFGILLKAVVGLEVTIDNFLSCCKLRNDKVSLHHRYETCREMIMMAVSEMQFFGSSGTLKCIDIITPSKFYRTDSSGKVVEIGDDGFVFDAKNTLKILKNVVVNALVHTEAERIVVGVKDTILLQDTAEGSELCLPKLMFYVREEYGPGIDREYLQNIQEEASHGVLQFRERFENSLGLGLVVIVHLSKFIRGSVTFENISPRGSLVSISVPIINLQAPQEKVADKRIENRRSVVDAQEVGKSSDVGLVNGGGKPFGKHARELKILVIDDSAFLHNFYRLVLKNMGFSEENICFTHCPTKAVELLRELGDRPAYDILFTDLLLGPCTGVELVDELDEVLLPNLIVLVTGIPLSDQSTKSARIHESLAKPIRVKEIKKVCDAYISEGLADV